MEYIKKLTAELVEKILAKGVRDMPQNPAAQGYDERQIRGFYYIPEKEILGVIMEIEATLSQVFTDIKNNKVNVSDVIDNLYSSEQTKPLSANMGRNLNSQIATERSLRMSLEKKSKDYQTKTDKNLKTESKDIVDAINEVNKKAGQGGGSSIEVDTELSDTSTNPVQNKVVKEELDKKVDKVTTTSAGKWVYGYNNNGDFSQVVCSSFGNSSEGNLPQYFNSTTTNGSDSKQPQGVLLTNTPQQPYHAANKKYVDENKGTQLYKHEFAVKFPDYFYEEEVPPYWKIRFLSNVKSAYTYEMIETVILDIIELKGLGSSIQIEKIVYGVNGGYHSSVETYTDFVSRDGIATGRGANGDRIEIYDIFGVFDINDLEPIPTYTPFPL